MPLTEEEKRKIAEEEIYRKEVREKEKGKDALKGFLIFLVIMVIVFAWAFSGDEKKEGETQQPQVTESAETKYGKAVIKISEDVAASLAYISHLTGTKPLIYWTDAEILGFVGETVSIEKSYESAKNLDPPERFQKAHTIWLSGLKKNAQAMPIFRSGVENLDANKIEQANSLMLEGNKLLKQATEELEKLEK